MSSDSTLELLQKIDARLARLEDKMEKTPQMAMDGMAIIGDSIDEKFNPQTENGLNNLAKVEKAQKLLDQLTDDETLDSIQVLLENLKHVSPIVSKLKMAEDGVSIFADSFDEFFNYAMKEGVDIENLSNQFKIFSQLFIKALDSGAFTNLMDSGVLDLRSIETVGAVGRSMAVSCEARGEAGPIKVLTSLMDRDVQKSLGFLLTFAKHFGSNLNCDKTKRINL